MGKTAGNQNVRAGPLLYGCPGALHAVKFRNFRFEALAHCVNSEMLDIATE